MAQVAKARNRSADDNKKANKAAFPRFTGKFRYFFEFSGFFFEFSDVKSEKSQNFVAS